MLGIGNMGMGSIGGNLVGLAGLGNAMGIGGPRGIGGAGISSPMAPMSNLGNAGQNTMNLGQASSINAMSQRFQSGSLNPVQAAALKKIRMMRQNRANMLGGPQSGIGGVPGARQMPLGSAGLSVLGPGTNRPNMGAMQWSVSGPMAPPKMMAGMGLYVNPQQQQQMQQQQQIQQHQHMQLQQQLAPQKLNQQETNSPLQSVMSPGPQMSSPPNQMGITQLSPQQLQQQVPQPQQQQLPLQQPQQQLQPQQTQQQLQPQQSQQQQSSPQQMSQRTPMSPQQMSSGAIQPMSASNPDACPASPQVSSQSQTLGSVGSITNSPMDVQNKSNSMGNP